MQTDGTEGVTQAPDPSFTSLAGQIHPMCTMQAAATFIASNRLSLTRLPALEPSVAPTDLTGAYQTQEIVHSLLAAEFGDVVGYKIGCTSDVMQAYLAISHPCSGALFAKRMHASGVELPAGTFVRVGVECEIALRMGRDLPDTGAPHTCESVADAIDAYFPAIEIVDDRYVAWETLGAPTLVADDFFAAGCVLGAPVARSMAPDLLEILGRASINGVEVGRGRGKDLLGHPHNALAWLANHLSTRNERLRAGQIVSTGSVIQTVWLDAGDVTTMDFTGLGTVALRLT